MAVRTAMEHKAERKDICTLVQHFAASEETVIKFLEANKTWCGIPEQAIAGAKANHENTLKFRTVACTEAPAAKPRAALAERCHRHAVGGHRPTTPRPAAARSIR